MGKVSKNDQVSWSGDIRFAQKNIAAPEDRGTLIKLVNAAAEEKRTSEQWISTRGKMIKLLQDDLSLTPLINLLLPFLNTATYLQ